MNSVIFKKLMKKGGLKQEGTEWRLFLEFCSMFLKKHKIKNPVVVELGIGKDRQKGFWEQLFAAKHIGIDISDTQSVPDILGDTHNLETLKKLKGKLVKRMIDILFIDASHTYESVTNDFNLYAPLCDGLVVLHDIETFRNRQRKSSQVWKFWDELKLARYKDSQEYKDYPFITIFHRRKRGCQRGIGIIIKK